MKVKFCIDGFKDSGWLDPVKNLCLQEGEWEAMEDGEKYEYADHWACENINIYFDEQP